jgi:hypothetical protein
MKSEKKNLKETGVTVLIIFFLILSLVSIFLLKTQLSLEQENSLQESPIVRGGLRYLNECKQPLFMALEKQTVGSCGTACLPEHPPIKLHHYGKCKINKKGMLRTFNLGDSEMEDFVGDVNNDGFKEVVLIPIANSQTFFVYSGKDGSLLTQKNVGSQIKRIFGLEDVNGDGKGDVAVQIDAPGQLGYTKVMIYSGDTGSLINEIFDSQNQQPWEKFGYSVESIGDIMGNGINELAISSPWHDGAQNDMGKIYIYSFSQGTFNQNNIILGSVAFQYIGHAGVGTLNNIVGNVNPDFYINGEDIARIYTYNQGTIIQSAELIISTTYPLSAVLKSGDFDGDGINEIAVAQGDKDEVFPESIKGLVEIYDSNLMTILWSKTAERIINTDHAPFSKFGRDITIIDDINRDGIPELVISSPGLPAKFGYNHWTTSTINTNSGAIYIFDVANDEVLQRYVGDSDYQGLGHRLTSIEQI